MPRPAGDTTDDIKADLAALPDGLEAKVTGPGRVHRRRGRRLQRHQRHAAVRDRGARPDPADRDLPQPDLLADPVLRGAAGRGQLARLRLSARGGRRDGHRAVGRHPAGARVRRRHRLRAADGLAIPRGAAPPRGQARRDPRCPAPHLPSDPRLRRDRDGGAVDPVAGRGQRHRRTRPDRRDGDRPRDGLDAHDAAGAPGRVRAPGVLAVRPALRRRRAPTRPMASGGGSPSGWAAGRAASGSARPPCSRCWRSASPSSTATSPPATCSATTSTRCRARSSSRRASPRAPTGRPTCSSPTLEGRRRAQRRSPRRLAWPRSAATSEGPTGTKIEATLDRDPFSTAAFDLIPGMRDAVHAGRGRRRAGRRPLRRGARPARVHGARQPR